MSHIQKAELLSWLIDTIQGTSYKTARELIQTLTTRPGGAAFLPITAVINKYENVFIARQQDLARDGHPITADALADITLKPEFKQALVNTVIYLVEQVDFREFLNDARRTEYTDDVLNCVL